MAQPPMNRDRWRSVRAAAGRFDPRIATAAILFAVGLSGAIVTVAREQRSAALVSNDNRRVAAGDRLLSAVKDVEAGERQFVITGRDDDLARYEDGTVDLGTQFDVLDRLGFDIQPLRRLVDAKLAVVREVVALRHDRGPAATLAALSDGRDKLAMDHIRAAIDDLRDSSHQHSARVIAGSRFWTRLLLPLSTLAALLGFIGIVALALQRRRLEHISRTRLTGVLDNAPIGLGFLGPDLRIRHMNRALAEMSERALGAGVGESLWDVLPGMQDRLEPRIRQVIDSGRTVRDVEFEATSPNRPGQSRAFLLGFFPMAGESFGSGNNGAGLVVSDITVRKRAERRLHDTEQRFRALVSASTSIMWVAGPGGTLDDAQPGWTRFTGQSTEALLGQGWLDAIHPDDQAQALRDWTDGIAAGEAFTTGHRLRRADGEWRDMAVQVAPLLEEDGAIREWVGAHTDVTDMRRSQVELESAKEAAEAANRAKSQFLANMSHELRTPLSAVIGYSEMLEEEMQELNQPALLDDLQKINSNARHLLSLINDVLDLSKIEADRMTTYAEDVDAADLLHEVASTVQALVTKKGNALLLDIPPAAELGRLRTDQVKLRQCLFNLIGNAGKFTENGRITLSCRREPDDVICFAVADTGIGMSPEQLERLFERFSQADDSTTRRFGGSGLGLSITRAFCRLLGGEIAVTSQEGRGSVFTIRIPATLPEPDAPTQPAAAEAGHPSAHTVLVVDDDEHQRSLLTRFLEREGFAVRSAADGRTGLELARTLHPRAILLDVMMPQMDGWSVLTSLKAEKETADIPVVMVTFVNEPALGKSLGAAELIPKPIDWDRLKHVLDRFHGENRRILVVDDDDDARSRIRTVLERNGWSAMEAANGKEALERFDEHPQCLILLDLTMPVMDGFSFLHELRERPRGRDVPVVVLTARDLSAEERRRLEKADRVLQKGETSMRTLANEVRALAGGGSKMSGAPPG